MAEIFKAYDIRGVYPVDINGEIAEKIGRAYIEFTGAKKVVVGRDMRPHSQGCSHTVFQECFASD